MRSFNGNGGQGDVDFLSNARALKNYIKSVSTPGVSESQVKEVVTNLLANESAVITLLHGAKFGRLGFKGFANSKTYQILKSLTTIDSRIQGIMTPSGLSDEEISAAFFTDETDSKSEEVAERAGDTLVDGVISFNDVINDYYNPSDSETDVKIDRGSKFNQLKVTYTDIEAKVSFESDWFIGIGVDMLLAIAFNEGEEAKSLRLALGDDENNDRVFALLEENAIDLNHDFVKILCQKVGIEDALAKRISEKVAEKPVNSDQGLSTLEILQNSRDGQIVEIPDGVILFNNRIDDYHNAIDPEEELEEEDYSDVPQDGIKVEDVVSFYDVNLKSEFNLEGITYSMIASYLDNPGESDMLIDDENIILAIAYNEVDEAVSLRNQISEKQDEFFTLLKASEIDLRDGIVKVLFDKIGIQDHAFEELVKAFEAKEAVIEK